MVAAKCKGMGKQAKEKQEGTRIQDKTNMQDKTKQDETKRNSAKTKQLEIRLVAAVSLPVGPYRFCGFLVLL